MISDDYCRNLRARGSHDVSTLSIRGTYAVRTHRTASEPNHGLPCSDDGIVIECCAKQHVPRKSPEDRHLANKVGLKSGGTVAVPIADPNLYIFREH